MHDFVVRLIGMGGYWGVFVLMVLENVFPPIPSELIMGLGGVAVARGTMDFWPLLIVGTLGAVIGNYAWFLLGQRLGYKRLRPFVARWGRWLTIDWHDVEKTSAFFRRHGHWVVFFLRFSPLMRTMISLPAGLAHMSLWRFLVFTTFGAAIWNVFLIKGGQWVGSRFDQAETWLGWLGVGTFVVLGVWYVYRVVTWKPES